MNDYLKNRFVSVSINFTIIVVLVCSMFAFIFYNQNSLNVLWSFLISVPIMIGAFLFGVKRWNKKLHKLSDTEFILTESGIVQRTPNSVDKYFEFVKIAVIDKKKFGTTIIIGNWLTKINYYRPKDYPYQLDDPKLIFIPSITTNYSELIDEIKHYRRLKR